MTETIVWILNEKKELQFVLTFTCCWIFEYLRELWLIADWKDCSLAFTLWRETAYSPSTPPITGCVVSNKLTTGTKGATYYPFYSRGKRVSRTIALSGSYSKDQLISNEELGERQLHISGKAFHTGASPPLPPSFSSTKDTSRFKKKQQASRLSCSLLPQPPCLFFPLYHSHGAF